MMTNGYRAALAASVRDNEARMSELERANVNLAQELRKMSQATAQNGQVSVLRLSQVDSREKMLY